MVSKLIALKFIDIFGGDEVSKSLHEYADAKSDFINSVSDVDPLRPRCPPAVDFYDTAIWAYALNLYEYMLFTILGTIAFLAMLGHLVLRAVLSLIA